MAPRSAPTRVENVICCCDVCHRRQLEELLSESESHQHNKWIWPIEQQLYKMCSYQPQQEMQQMTLLGAQLGSSKIRNLICHRVSRQADVGGSL